MSEQLFDVVFFGILQSGKNKDTVIQNMATLFKTDTTKLSPYFAGGRKAIKRNINAEAAEKYKAALENVGLVIILEACSGESDTTEDNSQANDASITESSSNKSGTASTISIAPVGADVLEHPAEKPVQPITDISDITMADAGADVIENPVSKPVQEIADTNNLSMAEAGSNVLDKYREVTPQKIADISNISLAEAGADLIENPKPKEKAPVPDTSELTLD